MKKHFIIYIILLCNCSAAFAQIVTSLSVNNPSAIISEWAAFNSTIVYTAENVSAISQQVVIKAELLTTDGNVIATKDLTKAQVFSIQGTRIFYAKDVFPLNEMIFAGGYKKTLEQTGALPSGTYQINVQLVEPGTFRPLSVVKSRIFNLATLQLPFLVSPANDDSLQVKKAETAIIFRWTPLTPQTQQLTIYRLQVFQVYPYQQPLQALRGNQPLLDQMVRGTTQFIWRPQIPFSTDTLARKFIWTIQTLNNNRQPIIQTAGNGESRSEPFVFFIR